MLCGACNKDGSPTPFPTENVAGTYNQTLTIEGAKREYIVYVPASAAGNESVPVLFMLHGTNQTGQFHYDKNLWNPKAEQEGFIAVYPTALEYCHFDNGIERTTTKWAAGNLGQSDLNRGALPLCPGEVLKNDMGFFDELSSAIKRDFVVDEKRFYLTGFSNGAQMTARLVTERSETYAAAAIHAGSLSAFIEPALTSRPMSLFITVGAVDGLFANAVGMDLPIPVDSNLLNNTGVQDVINPFLQVNGLSSSYNYSIIQNSGLSAASFLFETSEIGLHNHLRFTLIGELGHSYTDRLIDPYWSFFKEESLP